MSRNSLRRSIRPAAVAAAAILTAFTTGCHLDMYDQPKYKPLAESSYYPDKLSARVPPEGTVAHGSLTDDSLLTTGKVDGQLADLFPFAITDSLLTRGQDNFNTFCSPCHGRTAEGNGMVVQRGFPAPPSFLSDSLRRQPAGFFFDVMTNGFGRMYSYAPSVPVRDRWTIVAYIRALQLGSHMAVGDLSPAERNKLSGQNQ